VLQARRIIQGQTSGPLSALVAICGLAPLAAFLLLGEPVHFDIPKLGGFNFTGGLEVIPELLAMVVALSLFSAAFIAEIVRSGIQSVSHGQLEAAAALGLKRGLQLRLVVLPQALRVMMPPVTSEYLNILKNSSLSAAIAYPDLVQVFAGTTLNQTGQAVEIIAITMAFYLTVSTLVSSGMAWVQHRRDRREANR
jgi:general L-amino acid transport system permease protein